MKFQKSTLLFACGFVLAFLPAFTGCDSKSTSPGDSLAVEAPPTESTLKGDIKINGSSTVQPISNAIREMFIKEHPGVNVRVDGAGTGNGFQEFYGKSTDISDASRPIKPGEFEECKANGVEFIELPVAYDGLTIVVHPENDWSTRLTVDQLKKIFVAGDSAKTWKDVDESWPEEDINIFAPGTGSGTYDYFHEVVAKKDKKELRDDMNLNEDDNILVQGVAGNKYSIGFFGVAYYEENKDSLKAVEIVNPKDSQAYLPTNENIATNKYAPFSRPLFIYVNTDSLNRADVQTFVEFFMNNVSTACEKVGYVRLPDEIIAKGKENIDSVVVGTHFVDADGESRSGPLAEIFKPENLVK
ncbi:MAG: PstS family phosphate ABC transporter substrate-binding protein [Pirellulaceae bacterium]|nr:PstS family phosphate ABC transporter substrate-binding protein [Pirellulaceae bacterium]